MNISVIVAHPKEKSFNCAVALRAAAALKNLGHRVSYHDLYREGFDPLMSARELGKNPKLAAAVKKHCEEIAEARGVVIVHPNWWGQPPAILTGWIDRVLRQGVAYEFKEGDGGEGVPQGLLKIRSAVVFNTSDTPAAREKAVFGDPLENIWKKCVFDFCGVNRFVRKTYGVVVTSSKEEREEWLEDAGATVKRVFGVVSRQSTIR